MLDNIDKKNPFRTPENYFENFHKEMMCKIQQNPEAKIIPLWRKIAPWASVAAVLGGIIFTVATLINNTIEQPIADNDYAIEQPEKVFASSSEDEDFYLYLEDLVAKDSFYETINF